MIASSEPERLGTSRQFQDLTVNIQQGPDRMGVVSSYLIIIFFQNRKE